MTPRLSQQLLNVVDALPLREGMRVLEIGCGPGAAAREVAHRHPFDLAFAVRVGALDGRHPVVGRQALARLAHALSRDGLLLVERGAVLVEVSVPRG